LGTEVSWALYEFMVPICLSPSNLDPMCSPGIFSMLQFIHLLLAKKGDEEDESKVRFFDKLPAVWVKCQSRQMKLYKRGVASTMTHERMQALLESVGFDWNPRNL